MKWLIFWLLLMPIGVIAQYTDQQQRDLDSLNEIIKDPNAHDTLVAYTYMSLANILYLSNLDTVIPLCQKTIDLANHTIASNNNPAVILSLKKSLASAINNIGYIHVYQDDIEKGLKRYNESLAIRKEIGDQEGEVDVLNNIGLVYIRQGEVDKAVNYYNQALAINEEIGDEKGIAMAMNNIAGVYDNQGHIEKALTYYHQCLMVFEKIEFKPGQSSVLNNIASIHDDQGDRESALKYYYMALKLDEELGNKRGASAIINNIGVVHTANGDYDKALSCFEQYLEFRTEIGDKRGEANALSNIGTICDKQGMMDKALRYYRASLKIRRDLNDKKGEVSVLNHLSSVMLKFPNNDSLKLIRDYAELSMSLSHELGFPREIGSSAAILYKLSKRELKFKESLDMYELHIQMRDSVKNEENQKAAIRQQTKYEFEKAQLVKEQEEKDAARIVAEQTSRRDNLQYSVILIALLTLFGGVLALGFINVSEKMAEGLIFFSFLILFEFLLVLADPQIEGWSGGAPGIKLLFNAGIAALIFPAHAFFESKLKRRLVKGKG